MYYQNKVKLMMIFGRHEINNLKSYEHKSSYQLSCGQTISEFYLYSKTVRGKYLLVSDMLSVNSFRLLEVEQYAILNFFLIHLFDVIINLQYIS